MVWCQTSRLSRGAAVFLIAGTAVLAAQTRSTTPDLPVPTFGSVSGHVSFAGNNAPARFASIALQPVENRSAVGAAAKPPNQNFSVYQTDLSGDFHIDHVATGTYYVIVKYPGAVSPFAPLRKPTWSIPPPRSRRR